jgi:DNA-binding MarR family transcriptional regulator
MPPRPRASLSRAAKVSPIARPQRDEVVAALERALTLVVRLARPRLHRPALASVGGPPLDPAAYVTLLWIADTTGCRLTELAALLGVDVSTTSRQVSSLELAGLVDRRVDPGDQRSKLLALSDEGVELLSRARRARQDAVASLLSDWPPEEVQQLAGLLDKLAANLAGRNSAAGVEAAQ